MELDWLFCHKELSEDKPGQDSGLKIFCTLLFVLLNVEKSVSDSFHLHNVKVHYFF